MPKVGNFETIPGAELRRRIDRLGQPYVEAARRLGITEDGLHKAMSGVRRVGRQTEIILEYLEALHSGRLRYHRPYPHRAKQESELPFEKPTRRRDLAQSRRLDGQGTTDREAECDGWEDD